MDKTSLGDRMKRYELVTKNYVMPRTPIIIRVDGKAFHTFTKRLNPDVDPSCATGSSELMHKVMMDTAYYMSVKMQNVVVAYTQSDEISFVFKDWDTHQTQQWFGGSLQKMASVSASMATAYFNYSWARTFGVTPDNLSDLALFDSRVFMVPHEEVTNYLVWRQQDATRNSIQFLGHKYFSHTQLHKKNISEIQEMLFSEHGINWNNIDTWKKRGSCIINLDNGWAADDDIPVFTSDRDYIEKLLVMEE